MVGLIKFMNGPVGRTLRIGLGLVLIVWGLVGIQAPWGYLVAALGLVPLSLGLSGRCILEPLVSHRP